MVTSMVFDISGVGTYLEFWLRTEELIREDGLIERGLNRTFTVSHSLFIDFEFLREASFLTHCR